MLANRGSGSGCLAPAICLHTLSQNTISFPGCFPLRSLRLCGETQDPFRAVDQRGAIYDVEMQLSTHPKAASADCVGRDCQSDRLERVRGG